MKPTLVIAAAAALLFALLAFGAWVREDDTDWNPFVRDQAQLEGRWLAEAAELQVAGGKYQCAGAACAAFGTEGRWYRVGDFYVRVEPVSGVPQLLRLGIRGAMLVAAAGATASDPDQWNPEVKFTRLKPWRPQ
jgi:hypothetical protein